MTRSGCWPWTRVNAGRWQQAFQLEAAKGTAVCDSDPLKLHYSWCLARLGAEPHKRFDCELTEVRRAISRTDLGLPDLTLVTSPTRRS